MAVVADIFEAAAHKAERLIFRSTFYLVDTFYSFLVINIAANSIDRISRIADYSSVPKLVDHLLDKSWLWIIRIYFKKHGYSVCLKKLAGTDYNCYLCPPVRH